MGEIVIGEIVMGEREYLEEQCRRAKMGMVLAMRDLKKDAIEIADPRVWARAHPLATVAAAFMAGFAVTRVIEKKEEPVEMRSAQAEPVDHGPGRLSRLLSVGLKIWSVAEPFVRAAVVARMSESEPAQHS
ncbi:MAG TPA: hypothetical protein VGG44_08250 [Tepidisphaeraceae bacterium]